MVSGHDLPPTEHDIPETDSSARQELTAKPRKPPTIRDVAAEAGVSRATVSRVLNGGKWVSPSAAKAVEEAMTRMRYVASHSARSLNTRRSGAVALVVTQRRDHLFEDPSLSVLTRELMTRLAEYQRTLFVTVAADEASRKSVIQQMRSGLLDGLILASTQGDDPLPEALAAADLPAVLCGEPPEGASGLPHVKVDDRAGAAAMTEHLLNRVQGRIGLLTGPQNSVSSANRLAGYRDALGDDFSDRFVMECDADSAYAGETGMRSLLERVPYLDAVFATSDLLAHGALRALDRAGRRIPEDIAVGGFDDSILAAMSTPQLTSVHVPYDEIAQAAVELIAAKLEDQTAEPVRVTCRLVERAST